MICSPRPASVLVVFAEGRRQAVAHGLRAVEIWEASEEGVISLRVVARGAFFLKQSPLMKRMCAIEHYSSQTSMWHRDGTSSKLNVV